MSKDKPVSWRQLMRGDVLNFPDGQKRVVSRVEVVGDNLHDWRVATDALRGEDSERVDVVRFLLACGAEPRRKTKR